MVHDPQLDVHQPTAHRLRRIGRFAGALGCGLAVLLALAAVLWCARGGSLRSVRTASMGVAAPVGSLLIDAPARRLHVGDLISFQPPDSTEIFTHRILALPATGAVLTKGDANGSPDVWRLSRTRIRGRVVLVLPGVGWLLDVLPALLGGAGVIWLLTRWCVAAPWRTSARLSGITSIVVTAAISLHVMVNAAIISFARGSPGAVAAVISTGLLPLRVTAVNGTSAVVRDGAVARVWTAHPDAHRHYRLHIGPDWELWWMVPLAGLVLLPGCVALRVREGGSVPRAVATVAAVAPPPVTPWRLAASVPAPVRSASVPPPTHLASVPPPGHPTSVAPPTTAPAAGGADPRVAAISRRRTGSR